MTHPPSRPDDDPTATESTAERGSGRGDPSASGLPSGLLPLADTDPRYVGGFRLVGRVGAGGMGVVYAALDDRDTCVAVKAVHRVYAADADFRARFAREVELVRRVRAACVPAFRGADTTADTPWLATEYVPGLTLARHVAEHGPLPGGLLRAFAAGVAEALAAIHAADVVHRDLKPGNVILSPTGPKVLDFGIARAAEETAITRTGALVGTAGWIAPEQYRGEPASDRSDIHAWAALVAYAATGRHPYGSGSSDVLAARILGEEPDLSGLPDDLAEPLGRALAKNPAERPTAAEALARLGGKAGDDGEASEATTTVLAPDSAEVTLLLAEDWTGLPAPGHHPDHWARHAPPRRSWATRNRRTLTVAAAALTATLLVGGTTWALVGGGTQDPADDPVEGIGPETVDSADGETDGVEGGAAEADADTVGSDADDAEVPEPYAIPEQYRRMFETGYVEAEVEPGPAPRVVHVVVPPITMNSSGLDPMNQLRVTFDTVESSGDTVEFTVTAEYLLDFGVVELSGAHFHTGHALYSEDAYVETVLPEDTSPITELSPLDPTATFTVRFTDIPDIGVVYYVPQNTGDHTRAYRYDEQQDDGPPDGVYYGYDAGFCYSGDGAPGDFPDAPGFMEHRLEYEDTYDPLRDTRPPPESNSCIYQP